MQRATPRVDKAQSALLLLSLPKPSGPKASEAKGALDLGTERVLDELHDDALGAPAVERLGAAAAQALHLRQRLYLRPAEPTKWTPAGWLKLVQLSEHH